MFEKKFLKDKDLEFLEECSNEDLKVLADLLVYDKDNNPRYSETLSRTRLYKESYPNQLQKAWAEIAHEFQLYGGDSFANFFRGYGVPYREILMDVCDKKKVNYNKNSSTERIEMYLIQKLMDDVLEEMDDEQLQELVKDLQLDANTYQSKDAMKKRCPDGLHVPGIRFTDSDIVNKRAGAQSGTRYSGGIGTGKQNRRDTCSCHKYHYGSMAVKRPNGSGI